MSLHQLTDEHVEKFKACGEDVINVVWELTDQKEATELLFDIVGWASEQNDLLQSVRIRRERLTEYLGCPPHYRVPGYKETHVWALGWVSTEQIYPVLLYSGISGISIEVMCDFPPKKVILLLKELKSLLCKKK